MHVIVKADLLRHARSASFLTLPHHREFARAAFNHLTAPPSGGFPVAKYCNFSDQCRMKIAFTLTAILVASPVMADTFSVDVPQEKMRKDLGIYTIGDLGVGEEGRLSFSFFCMDGDTAKIPREVTLSAARSESDTIVKMEPGGTIAVQVQGRKSTNMTADAEASRLLAMARNCTSEGVPISTVNGKAKASELNR